MSTPPYRALRVLLGLICAGTAIGGLLLILGDKGLILRIFMSPPGAEVPPLLLMVLKEMGGALLMFSLLVFFALRDPARNVAIIDALIFGLCIASVTPLLSFYMLGLDRFFPAYLIWVRALVRLGFAVLLIYLRPRPLPAALRGTGP